MKKFLIILALMASMPLFAEHVDPETARKVAATFLGNNGAKADQLTDLSKAAGFPNLYIFTTGESFVIVPADDRITPVLGYSTENPFLTENLPSNLCWWLSGYDKRIVEIRNNNETAPEEVQKEWKDLISGKNDPKTEDPVQFVTPMISTHWAQREPFNNLCPANTVTGCVATAMAQIMKKWNYPETGIGSHAYIYDAVTHSVNFGNTIYDWDNMIESYATEYNSAQATAVATLMYHCGVSVEMKYVPNDESGSTVKRACIALKTFFNYTGTYLKKSQFNDETSWINRVKQNLDQGMPLLYGGYYNDQPGGHAFVCDGYDESDKLHFNWGWGPGSEGYYSVNSHDYSRNQDAVFGLRPVTCNAEKPSFLTCSAKTGHIVTLTWDPGSNAEAYNIYRNNMLIGTTDDVSFVDTEAVPGDNIYYIRSIDNNGNLSLASNQITENASFQTPVVEDLNIHYSNGNPTLSWSTPWWHPQTSTGTVAYVEETRPELDSYVSWENYEGRFMMYWGSLYPAEDLTEHQGKAIYKTTFYASLPGNYKALIYQGTDSETQCPKELKAVKSINTSDIGWVEIPLDEPVFLDSNKDLWVFIYDADGKTKQLPCLDVTSETNHQFFSSDRGDMQHPPHEGCSIIALEKPLVWLIRTYLTDGTYSYNLYDDNSLVNTSTVSETSYTVSDPSIGLHPFTVKTFFNSNESGASNTANLAVGNVMLTDLVLEDDNITVAPTSTLTVSRTLENTNPANLVLEDGAKLITSSEDVEATVKKNINDWNTTSWYFIASPLTGTTYYSGDGNNVTGLITDEYVGNEASVENATFDLYYLDITATPYIWKNYRKSQFNLTNGTGYLYANKDGTSLEFSGTIPSCGTAITTDNLNEGFNLVGNPYTCDAYVNQAYYTLSQVNEGISNSTTATLNTVAIPPCTGIIVQSVADGSVTFSKDAPVANKGNLQMTLAQTVAIRGDSNAVTIDNAIVSFSEGTELGKYYFSQQNANIYIPQDDEEFAIAYSQGQGMVPVCFKAKEDGEYTITVNPEAVEMCYLILIDNITGQEVDLMANPSYTFDATTNDYASRFKLVFSAKSHNSEAIDESFAFISDGQIIFTDVYDNATLQVIDMAGRVVVSIEGRTRCVPTTGMKPGAYVLQIITENETKTQKIIIK